MLYISREWKRLKIWENRGKYQNKSGMNSKNEGNLLDK